MSESRLTSSHTSHFRASHRVVVLVALAGIVLTSLQFMLAQGEVERFLSAQSNPTTTETLVKFQKRIGFDLYLLQSAINLLSDTASQDTNAIDRLKAIPGLANSSLIALYRYTINDNRFAVRELIFRSDRPENLLLTPEQTGDLSAIVLEAHTKDRPIVHVISEEPSGPLSQWLVVARPTHGQQAGRSIVVGMIPFSLLTKDIRARLDAGDLFSFSLNDWDAQSEKPFLTLLSPVHEHYLLTPVSGTDQIRVEDRIWAVNYTARPDIRTKLIAALPLALLTIGAALTLALVIYLRITNSRGAEVSSLAQSLRLANEKLSHQMLDEEKMARALRESEQKYRAIFENAGIGICQIASTSEWINANRTMAQILGFDNAQELLLAQPDLHGNLFVDPSARRDWFARLGNARQQSWETELHHRRGGTVWVNMTGHAVRDTMGDIMHYECTMFDITERRRTEFAMLAAKEQADFANRSKSEFLANMSHELRTPLNAIIGFSEIIRDQLFGPVGQAQYVEYAGDIFDSGTLLLSLINDILDMSKIEAGKRELAETMLNVEQTIHAVVRLVAARAKAHKLKLIIKVPHDIPPLRAEERAIKQILTNLLTNAIKFTHEGGSVALTAALDDRGRLVIKVEDTGIGMSAEEIPIALAPFGQIESALSRKNQGTGLGLPLTVALAELHGGHIDIQSKVGIGTLVTLTFPADRVAGRAV